ncbi:MAG: hypothetical protein ACK4EY_00895 [Flavipsychrobacter sp.]|nr:hypothetical protein [Chitinophagales bacterium]
MRRIFAFIVLLMPSVSFGQQNLFNVPSSDITRKNGLFFQQQANLYKGGFQLNTTLSYGLGKQWEIGVNTLGVTYDNGINQFVFDDTITPYAPIFAFNAQKKFVVNKNFSIGAGFQLGLNTIDKGGAYCYVNGVYNVEKTGTKLIGGIYSSTDGMFGSETRNWITSGMLQYVGIQAGVEQNIWKEKLLFQADFISGKHNIGEVVVGGAYCVTQKWVVSAGYQIPTFNSKSVDALVFELTYVP